MAFPIEEDHRWVATTVWDHINNREWDCGYKFEIHPLITGSFHVFRVWDQTFTRYMSEDMGKYKSIKEAKEAIGEWKLEEYKKWEFKQKNPVIHVG